MVACFRDAHFCDSQIRTLTLYNNLFEGSPAV